MKIRDYIISKLLSKKFICFCVATVLLCYSKLSSTEWLIIAGGYMGLETAINFLDKYVPKVKQPEDSN
jgi:succinate-acetate transporter protein